MKDRWEKTHKPVDLDREAIREMVKKGFGERQIVSSEPLDGGLCNDNVKLVLDRIDRPVVLRIYSGDEAICQKEIAISKLVRGTVPVPEVYECGVVKDHPFALVQWVEGVRLSEVMKRATRSELEEAGQAVGTVLADIHQFRFPKPGFFGAELKVEQPLGIGEAMFSTFMEECLVHGKAGHWLGKKMSAELLQFTHENAEWLAWCPEHFTLTHSDYNRWNVLMNPEKMEVAAVLDWEFAFSASAPVDIGNMLRYEPEGSPFETFFLRGFQGNGVELPKEWRKLSKLNDLIALVDLLNRSDSGENRIADLKQLIAGTVTNWD